MANPAPLINQINAFNVDVGTTIEFNIIGGTDLVRSNILYIYDLDDNSLICTHLYITTDNLHILPAKTDSSIIYADGKSSVDFVNNKQYYAQIQTFTDTAGTTGGSGLSISKLFWCLPTPSLTIDTIPAVIEITSYNISALYNSNINTEIDVVNITQQYQFNLYNSAGVLQLTSGVVLGSGERQGVTNNYILNYNFTGLLNNNSYYVVVTVTTTEGMTLTYRSNTFLVSIDAPVLDKAIVINDACNGYISVTSNLSDSYSSNINRILVKRKDINDVTNTWLTLFSIPISQASDMNFTVIDFYNQCGKTYQYALVPIIVQMQSGVEVEIEGGYTVSDSIESVFDDVFIVDNTNSQKLKAGVGYNDVTTNQDVGVIVPIGGKYPIIVTNSRVQYHTGSIFAQILPENYYTVYDLDRISMVNRRILIENFLTNKSPKILKDWNGNIWLIMITDNVSVSFTNEWGMGIGTFSASWTEIGDVKNQEDLENSGLISLGGV